MFSKISVAALTLLVAFTGVSHSAPLDVYTPRLLTPAAGAVWKIGTQQQVTWDTSSPPKQITNHNGTLILAKNGLLDYRNPLARGFDIMSGRQTVTVPNVAAADDYQLVLMGDSGNYGPKFSIRK
ncbi:hypothetical protein D9756_006816 [Leucocoprinus leucothites]|uniref:Yeast cell wall synthesis Kre9/Knh1-like N-terminal domain-containing protein n=1 Tax=Leucocoprinus leucothites TaxID=201217 RepID=A0A8H5G2P7_9AGAR|nr:hypothetical protein D9756_006816 [Leucoagaricus leucothites]